MNTTADPEMLECVSSMPSLLDYFAAHAPDQIPTWFVGVQPEYEGHQNPIKSQRFLDLPMEVRSDINGCLEAGTDVPPEHRWVEQELAAFCADKQQHSKDCLIARYFQWRKYYAEQMVEVMS